MQLVFWCCSSSDCPYAPGQQEGSLNALGHDVILWLYFQLWTIYTVTGHHNLSAIKWKKQGVKCIIQGVGCYGCLRLQFMRNCER